MTVGFVGLGRMGGPMCRNVIASSGEDVVFYDLSDEACAACAAVGGRRAASVAEVAAAADVLLTSLPGPAQMEEVALGAGGIAEAARPGAVWFDLSTNSPATLRRVAERLAERGIELLDAPVSGGPGGAEAATLSVMVGGSRETFAAHERLLRSFSANPIHVGGLTAGTVVKLVNNLIQFCSVATAAEAMMLGVQAGVDPHVLDSVIRVSAGDSLCYRHLAGRALSGDYSASFALELAYKDIRLALDLASELAVPLPLGAQTADLMRTALELGLAQEDAAAVMRVYETAQGRRIGPASAA